MHQKVYAVTTKGMRHYPEGKRRILSYIPHYIPDYTESFLLINAESVEIHTMSNAEEGGRSG